MSCGSIHRPAPGASDCLKAIEMFPGIHYPTGDFINRQVDPPPDPVRPISIDLDKRKYHLPAAFRSGTCVVLVLEPEKYVLPNQPLTHPPVADFLYLLFWPLMREAAKDMVHRCVIRRNAIATYMYTHQIYGVEWSYGVQSEFIPAGDKLDTKAGTYKSYHGYDSGKPDDWNPVLIGQKQAGISKAQEPSRLGKTSGAGSSKQ